MERILIWLLKFLKIQFVGCDRCVQKGFHDGHRVTNPDMEAALRTDENFASKTHPQHHHGDSPLSDLKIGMISGFPLDYMHLYLLGVTKKTIGYWMKGDKLNRSFKIGSGAKKRISETLVEMSGSVCREFARKTIDL